MPNIFTAFGSEVDTSELPKSFTYPFEYIPKGPSLLAVKSLQYHLLTQKEWHHNFGLEDGQEGKVIGKMFGVLLVKTSDNVIGYLAAFSGKLANSNHHPGFVPPVYDALEEGSFLNVGMQELNLINKEIKTLEPNSEKSKALKLARKIKSSGLQSRLFDEYHFLNKAGKTKSLRAIFKDELNQSPPSAAGECAAPKLLQYAFIQGMKPLALTEFWWGSSPKSIQWKHGHFYPVCLDKCQPILRHMLQETKVDNKPKSLI
jgi:tRNA pseudouridine32 synthase/23S rRNA pseudouridine746 synthase